MKHLLVASLFLAGCVGNWNGNPYGTQEKEVSIVTRDRAQVQPWWQASTAGVTSNNPWNKFVKPQVVEDTSDPWVNFQEPDLFPKNWKPENKKPLDLPKRRRILQHSREI